MPFNSATLLPQKADVSITQNLLGSLNGLAATSSIKISSCQHEKALSVSLSVLRKHTEEPNSGWLRAPTEKAYRHWSVKPMLNKKLKSQVSLSFTNYMLLVIQINFLT